MSQVNVIDFVPCLKRTFGFLGYLANAAKAEYPAGLLHRKIDARQFAEGYSTSDFCLNRIKGGVTKRKGYMKYGKLRKADKCKFN